MDNAFTSIAVSAAIACAALSIANLIGTIRMRRDVESIRRCRDESKAWETIANDYRKKWHEALPESPEVKKDKRASLGYWQGKIIKTTTLSAPKWLLEHARIECANEDSAAGSTGRANP